MKKLALLILLVTLGASIGQSAEIWYVVNSRTTGLANLSFLSSVTGFYGVGAAQGRIRTDLELRLDAAIMELKACNPERFDAVYAKYGLRFNDVGVAIAPGSIVPCATP